MVKSGSPPLKVLFVASECAPFAKCGGLGDVVASLPTALRRQGVEVRIILPLYSSVDRTKCGVVPANSCVVTMGNGEIHTCRIHDSVTGGGVRVWLVEYARYFDRAGIYDAHGEEFGDNAFRFGFLCTAAAQICRDHDWMPDVVHVHDWPTSIFPVLMETWRRQGNPFGQAASVLTIHNQAYQGYAHASVLSYLGLPEEEFFTPDTLESYGKLNLLKGGILFADAINTVSPTYAREILGEPAGNGLSAYLRRRVADFTGILNGADYDEWNPSTDGWLAARYDLGKMTGKAVCKTALRDELELAQDDVPLFGMVGRLTAQKGISLLRPVLPWVLDEMQIQLAVLGTGDPEDEAFFLDMAARYPGRVAARLYYSNELAHRFEAGSDFFLMPSLFEPCGLSQIYALRYGTPPLVHSTGGLEDTVSQYNEGEGSGTGFKFYNPVPQALHDVMGWAVSTYFDRPAHIRAMQQRGMAQRFDWAGSAKRYMEMYTHAIAQRRIKDETPAL